MNGNKANEITEFFLYFVKFKDVMHGSNLFFIKSKKSKMMPSSN